MPSRLKRKAGDGVIIIAAVLIAVLIAFAAAVVLVGLSNRDADGTFFETAQKIAGRYGEKYAASVIKSVLREGDTLLSNVSIAYDGRPAELDCVVVNKNGVFVIEVKNYVGVLFGKENEYEWKKYKKTAAGNVYEKTVKNPIKQVKRQVYILAKYLEYYGVDVWVQGYVMLVNGGSPVVSDFVLSDTAEIDGMLHKRGRTALTRETVAKIKELLE